MNSDLKLIRLIAALVFFLSIPMHGQVRLPRLVSDGMVLQRDAAVKIWGWASPNEKVSVRFVDSTCSTVADGDGDWKIVLPELKAGGPYEMQVTGRNAVTIRNIMIGDVWVCSGQSNMELPMRRASPIYESEIVSPENVYIRQFTVPQQYDFNTPHDDLVSGSWKTTNPQTILDFSAVAYFFGKELYDRYRVPIGLINSSLGGSPAEAWMSEEALRSFPAYYDEAQRFKDSSLIHSIESQDNRRIQAWYTLLRQKDQGYKDPQRIWYHPDLNTSDWPSMQIPGYWSDTELGKVHGVVWFRRDVRVPSADVGKRARLILGRIVDADSVFMNGEFVGTTSYQYPPRRYDLPPNLLKEGQNTIVIRVINNQGQGGFVPDKEYELVAEGDTIDLKGMWRYRLGANMEPLASQTFLRWKPLGLYNAMIAPLLNYRIKGVLWYQGEANANRPVEYRELLQALIRDWRKNWHQGDFPFLFVQLPNFMEPKSRPSESNWAMLREAQLRALSLPNTGMAVAIDVGEWNDIHPLNKKDVGKRLAVAAQKVAYGDTAVVSSGPIYRSMRIDGSKIILSFTNTSGGLIGKGGGELKEFAIAGPDKNFVWAHATIESNEVIVWCDSLATPVAVRYAWADNPDGANLFNAEGLPASPFRTDDWTMK